MPLSVQIFQPLKRRRLRFAQHFKCFRNFIKRLLLSANAALCQSLSVIYSLLSLSCSFSKTFIRKLRMRLLCLRPKRKIGVILTKTPHLKKIRHRIFNPDESLVFETFSMNTLRPYFTEKLISLMIIGLKPGCAARIHGCKIDRRGVGLIPPSKGLNLGWWIGTSTTVFYVTFLLVQVFIKYWNQPLKTEKKLNAEVLEVAFGAAYFTIPIALQLIFKLNIVELSGVINHVLRFFQGFTRTYPRCQNQGVKLMEVKVAELHTEWAYFAIFFLTLMFTLASFIQPQWKIFISAYITPTNYGTWCATVRNFASVTFLYMTLVYVTGALTFAAGFAPFFPCLAAFKYLSSIAADKSYDPKLLISTYQQLDLIFAKVNRIVSNIFLTTAQNILMTLTIFGIYGLVRLEGLTRVILASVGFVTHMITLVVFWTLAQVHTTSSHFLRTLAKRPTVTRREIAHLRPVRIMIGNFGYVDMGLTLTMCDIIVCNAIAMLLAG